MNDINQLLFGLLRSAFRGEPFTAVPSEKEWVRLYKMVRQQSLTGVVYQVVNQLETAQKPPVDLLMRWMGVSQTIRGLNQMLCQEAARLTKEFSQKGYRTAILKGQANARLYPDPQTRQPGDIDLWVEGGRKSVMALVGATNTLSNHHVRLQPAERGITVEIHFRPSSGNNNPITNRRLQKYLEQEIRNTTLVDEGFYVPSGKFALLMQLSHIQKHFLSDGVGLRQICDYYWLLNHATAEERVEVTALLHRFGLHHTAGALMWVLVEILHMDRKQVICPMDSYRGEWMLSEVMSGGNFGHYAERLKTDSDLTFFLRKVKHQMKMMSFAPGETIWLEVHYVKGLFKRIPERIRHGRLSLRDFPE